MVQETSEHSYSSYLQIPQLLSTQIPQTERDNELLFIIIHQSHELWFKLAIHELECAIRALAPPNRPAAKPDGALDAYKRLARVCQIQELQIASWSVLGTLTPDEFKDFRSTVGRNDASRFQSIQYRILEFKLGLKYREVTMDKKIGDQIKTETKSIFSGVNNED